MSEESKSTTVPSDTDGKVAESSKESTEDKEVVNSTEEKKEDKSPAKVTTKSKWVHMKLECCHCHAKFDIRVGSDYGWRHPRYAFDCGYCALR